MGPGIMHPQVVRKLVEEVAKLLSIIVEKLWQLSEVTSDWRRENITFIFKKRHKKDLGITSCSFSPPYLIRSRSKCS